MLCENFHINILLAPQTTPPLVKISNVIQQVLSYNIIVFSNHSSYDSDPRSEDITQMTGAHTLHAWAPSSIALYGFHQALREATPGSKYRVDPSITDWRGKGSSQTKTKI